MHRLVYNCRRFSSGLLLPLFTGMLILAGCDRNPSPTDIGVQGGRPDRYSTAADQPLVVPAPGVLANDAFDPAREIAVELVDQPRRGELQLNPDGSFRYSPHYKFEGNDWFTYRVVSEDGATDPVTVRIGFPNVVVIVIDDVGLGYIGAYNDKAPVPTPNLDELAAAGMRFTRAHSAAAVCSPSRYSIMTGNYPYRGQRATGVWNSYHRETMIRPEQDTLGDIFQTAGYRTAFIGKMHNGAAFRRRDSDGYTINPDEVDFSLPFDRGPTQFGFNYSFVLPGGLSAPPYAYFENDRMVRFDSATGRYTPFATDAEAREHLVEGLRAWGPAPNGGRIGGYGVAMDNYDSRSTGAILTRRALQAIDEAVAADTSAEYPQPFFVFFAPPQIHTPYTPPQFFSVDQQTEDQPVAQGEPVAGFSGRAPHLDLMHEVDLMVGAIVQHLNELGVLDDTLIVFSSDNGALILPEEADILAQGKDNGRPLRGYKGEIYEAGHRVPLIMRWGDGTATGSRIKPGSRSGERLGLQDLSATFYSLLGLQRPVNQANDSRSFLPELLGTRPSGMHLRDHLIVQGSPASAADNEPRIDRAYYRRDDNGDWWKLIVISSVNDPLSDIEWGALFNLTEDPAERNDRRHDANVSEWQTTLRAEYLQRIARPRTIDRFR